MVGALAATFVVECGAGAGSTCVGGAGGGDGANDESNETGTSALSLVQANVTDLTPVFPLKVSRHTGGVVPRQSSANWLD
jgi:hypothetical protein